eukprot:11425489-Ditylum_brightwellii.AAC.1
MIAGIDGGKEHDKSLDVEPITWQTSEARRAWEHEIKKSELDSIFLDSTSSLNRVRNDILDIGDETTSKFRVLLKNSSKAVQNFDESIFSSGGRVVTRETLVSDPLMWQTRERISISTLKMHVSTFTPEDQRQYPSISTIFTGGTSHQEREMNKSSIVISEAFCLIKNVPDIATLRDH